MSICAIKQQFPSYEISQRQIIYRRYRKVNCRNCGKKLENQYIFSNRGKFNCLDCALKKNMIVKIPATIVSAMSKKPKTKYNKKSTFTNDNGDIIICKCCKHEKSADFKYYCDECKILNRKLTKYKYKKEHYLTDIYDIKINEIKEKLRKKKKSTS